MKPSIFIHIHSNLTFLKYCLENFKNKCEIIVNCYGEQADVIEFCKQNSDYFYQIKGNKNDIIKTLPHPFEDGVWVCNDDVVVEGNVQKMFSLANLYKHCVDLIYPGIDSLVLDENKLGKHKKYRLYSPAYFLTQNGISKLKASSNLHYSYTYYGVSIKHCYDVIDLSIPGEWDVNFSDA